MPKGAEERESGLALHHHPLVAAGKPKSNGLHVGYVFTCLERYLGRSMLVNKCCFKHLCPLQKNFIICFM